MSKLVFWLLPLLLIVLAVTAESDFERRYGKYIRCKQTHKPSEDELEVYGNTDSICRQRARHAYGSDAGEEFHSLVNCVNHCVRNNVPQRYGDHIDYCVKAVDEGTYSKTECAREL